MEKENTHKRIELLDRYASGRRGWGDAHTVVVEYGVISTDWCGRHRFLHEHTEIEQFDTEEEAKRFVWEWCRNHGCTGYIGNDATHWPDGYHSNVPVE